MTDIISLLPDNIANQIAAGEVVQRPASAVKEMLENSVDSGASQITLIVKNGGKALIQVIDNGSGMSETDARMCFERHATSKIKSLEDIYALHTLGFRGEAMASIAAVAEVELKTRREQDEQGVLVVINNSELVTHEACACPVGTSISVKNLFFNVPARRNFLKSDMVEYRHIQDEFIRVALANPQIGFVLFNDNEEVFHLRGGNLKQRIIGIWGKKYDEGLVPVEEQTDVVRIKGFTGKPDFSRKTKGEQFFFANNRYIRNAYLHHAVMNAYEQLLPANTFPFYVLYLDLDPAKIDINVHPTKTEIKFEDEKVIYAMLRAAVKKALSQYHIAPSLNFEEEMSMRGGPSNNPSGLRSHTFDSFKRSTDSSAGSGFSSSGGSVLKPKASKEEWEELYKVLQMQADENTTEQEEVEELLESEAQDTHKGILQLHKKYIVTSLRSGLMLIHQSLAHERVLYERYMNAWEGSPVFSQRLLFPEVLQLSATDFALVKGIMADIGKLGFELEEFGKNAFVLNAIPAELHMQSEQNMLESIIEDYKNAGENSKLDQREQLAAALAKHAAIKAGKALSQEEMSQLIDELFACSMPYYSPDGKPVLITIPVDELDKKFKKQ